MSDNRVRRRVAGEIVVVGALLSGCRAPCEPRFVDHAGSGDAALADVEAAWDRFAHDAPDAPCVGKVAIDETERGWLDLRGSVALWVGPDAPGVDLRAYLCDYMGQHGFVDRDPVAADLDPEDARRAFDYACYTGPARYVDEIEAACGVGGDVGADPEAAFVRDEVFPDADDGADGPLDVTTQDVPLARGVLEPQRGGDALVGVVVGPARYQYRAVRVDVASGVITDLGLGALSVPFVYGGADTVAVPAGDHAYVVDTATWTVEDRPVHLPTWDGGAAAGGVLYLADRLGGFEGVALDTGVVTPLPSPAGEYTMVVNGSLRPVDGGVEGDFLDAEVYQDNDFVEILIHAWSTWRWDGSVWTEVGAGLEGNTIGSLPDGRRLVHVWSDAGPALAAVDGDRLLVSADVCVAETGWPFVVIGDAAYDERDTGDGVVLRKYRFP